jgi:hypothetical protein
MTHDDLATLLREDVTQGEPHWLPDVSVPVSAGRRRVRRHRIMSAAVAASALTVTALVAVPLLGGSAGSDRVLDPAERALAEYDAQQMPITLEEHSRAVFERSVPDLGPADVRVKDGNDKDLPPELYDKASGISVEYGDFEHSWSVSLRHAKSEAEGSARTYCDAGLEGGYYLECTVGTAAHGYVVISKLEAVQPFGNKPSDRLGFMVVTADELSTVDPDRVYFQHIVKVIKSESLLTYVKEQVHAPTREQAEAMFQTPLDDLAELGADPALVIPEAPLDTIGCGPFTLAKNDYVSC